MVTMTAEVEVEGEGEVEIVFSYVREALHKIIRVPVHCLQ